MFYSLIHIRKKRFICAFVDNRNSGENDTNITGLRGRGELLLLVGGFRGGQRLSFMSSFTNENLKGSGFSWSGCIIPGNRVCDEGPVHWCVWGCVCVYGHATKSSIG